MYIHRRFEVLYTCTCILVHAQLSLVVSSLLVMLPPLIQLTLYQSRLFQVGNSVFTWKLGTGTRLASGRKGLRHFQPLPSRLQPKSPQIINRTVELVVGNVPFRLKALLMPYIAYDFGIHLFRSTACSASLEVFLE